MTVYGTAARAVTIVLPTYNRASFLPAAFDSIIKQSFDDWDLVVVDDGSTDSSAEIVHTFSDRLGRRLRYVRQPNAGAYAARNRGLAEATGRYVAFFDSDDLWLPHHLGRCVGALDAHPDVDWVFGACRVADAAGATIEASTFHPGGTPRPFLKLRARRAGELHIIEDERVLECQILHGLYCGLQNSVIRRRLFEGRRFDDRTKVVDDEMFVIRVLAEGARFAYFDDTHVIYRVHDDNSSGSANGQSANRNIPLFMEMTASLEQLLAELPLRARERRALRQRLGREYFWHLGYGGYWAARRSRDALRAFERGLAVWPWSPAAWKTYAIAKVRAAAVGARQKRADP